jgi:hypothetical protein
MVGSFHLGLWLSLHGAHMQKACQTGPKSCSGREDIDKIMLDKGLRRGIFSRAEAGQTGIQPDGLPFWQETAGTTDEHR